MEQGGVWLFIEARIPESSFKLCGEARKLANQASVEVCAVLIGDEGGSLVKALGAYGVDKALVVEDQLLEKYTTEAYTQVLAGLVEEHKPLAVLFCASATGSDLAPRLAARLNVGFVANCIESNIDEQGRLVARKPICGGNLHATLTTLTKPSIASIDPRVLELKPVEKPEEPEIVRLKAQLPPSTFRTKVIDYVKAEPTTVGITEAAIVIGVGRGLGGVERIKAVEELARLLGGTVGGSRVAVDEGWVPYERQIGISGKSISPEVFIALGISGAHHFAAGVGDSRLIIAVNQDANAPIFKMADLGVVGDLHQVAHALIEQSAQISRKNAPG